MSGGTLKLKQEPAAAPTPASAPLKSTGDGAEFSLRLLQLVYRHDKDPTFLVERVRELKRLLLAPES